MRAVWVLHNSQAGRPAYVRSVDRAAEAIARRGVAVQVVRNADVGHLRQAARAAVAAGADAVLAAGGDGTLGAIAGELAQSPVAWGALPAGTANAWARQLALPRASLWQPHALEQVALRLLDSPMRLTDMGRCNESWFLIWAGVGLDATVVAHFERQRQISRRVGGVLYNTALTFVVARNLSAVELTLESAGPAGTHAIRGRFLMATVCAIGLHGGGLFRFADDVRLDDGLMDLWAFEGHGFADALDLAARVFRGTHHSHPRVHRLTGDSFDIYTAVPQAIQIDGEPRPAPDCLPQHLAVRVVPRSLRVLAPTATARALYGSLES